MGEKVIEGNNKKYVNNPLFILDFNIILLLKIILLLLIIV
jgi:hypothetical protein